MNIWCINAVRVLCRGVCKLRCYVYCKNNIILTVVITFLCTCINSTSLDSDSLPLILIIKFLSVKYSYTIARQLTNIKFSFVHYYMGVLCNYRMIIVNLLISLIILTSQCVCVHSEVIIVNSNNGNDNTECCVNGECACSSLSTALLNIDNNTIINITSQSVALNNTTTMGSGKLTNITITGSNVTIMCNNSGSVYCESCDDVMIKGITWDRCGDPNGTNIAGVTFNGISNISLVNCTFQHSQIPAVSLLRVLDIILIQGCNFLSNIPIQFLNDFDGILSISRYPSDFSSSLNNITVIIFKCYFYNNGYLQNFASGNSGIPTFYISITGDSVTNCNIILKNTKFESNRNVGIILVNIFESINLQLSELSLFNNSFLTFHHFGGYGAGINAILVNNNSDVSVSIISSNFDANEGMSVRCFMMAYKVSMTITDSNFTNSKLPHMTSAVSPVGIYLLANNISKITFYGVQINNNTIGIPTLFPNAVDGPIGAGAVSIVTLTGSVEINMHDVKFTSNQYLGRYGGALYVYLVGDFPSKSNFSIYTKQCQFVSNKSPAHGAALFIYTEDFNDGSILVEDTHFDQNVAGSSVAYIRQDGSSQHNDNSKLLQVNASTFTNNVASSMYLSACDVEFLGKILFMNNTADNGGAMYLNQGTTVRIKNIANTQFIANTAAQNGGAIYVDFLCDSLNGNAETFYYNSASSIYGTTFINNSARIAGNSIYFSLPRFCSVNANISDSDCVLYIPCQFNYSQPVNGKMMNISCDLDYTLLNGTGAAIVTSPHELRLYFPFSDGYNTSSTSDHNIYFVRNNILGYPVKFTGAVFDYLGKPTEPAQFNIQYQDDLTKNSKYTLINGNHNDILTQSIDNFTTLNVNFRGQRVKATYLNLTLLLTSLSSSFDKINATLVVELVPCINHPGYTYSEVSQTCICYDYNVKCNDDGNEIKRGHWFGSINGKATTSLCPNRYCKIAHRKQTSEGYFELPNTINAQCNDHRVGRACGECSLGYTLSYDSTDCISVDQCGTGWTVLVMTLTCLYWIAVVAGVFSLMYYLKFQISSGYLYGLIYYYSMVGILLNNNPYVSDGAFQFISALSSFAQLTPQFLGKLCFVKGLSGIDQLFIHYSHAVAVSLLLLLIVVAARCSTRITLFVSRCIIRVICLLILLSYTSIASTSLQLLLPLKFTDIKDWYAYSSPHIQYFHGRHAIYGVVAIICGLVVVGLSLLLLLEPVLSRKINFIRIKPLLDQLQGCYKDKYRWFAAYYLICRQVIFLIVYIFNSNYSNMLFYLQTACIIIAVIHMWFQPYHNELLNALDGVMLLVMVLVVNINTFTFLQDATTEMSVILVVLPLLLFCMAAVKKMIHDCFVKKFRVRRRRSHARQYKQIDIADDDDDDEHAAQYGVMR